MKLRFVDAVRLPHGVGQGTRCPPRWHRMQDSNLRQPVLETGALPSERIRHEKSAPARMGKDARGIWLLVPVSIVLTLETAFVGFIPAARRLIVALQAKNIIADVGNVEAQAAVDFSVVNGTKPFFKLHIITNAEFHAF